MEMLCFIMLVYVADLLTTCSNANKVEVHKLILKGSFIMKDLGTLKYFMSIEIAPNEYGVILNRWI